MSDDVPTAKEIQTTCCIAGGGPAGMMLGFLLARAGVDVIVLEKHTDFLRDFRGDTIHPSTLEIIHELGLLQDFLSRPHQKIYQLSGFIGGQQGILADFSGLPVQCPYIAMMPQWDFLDFLADQGRKYSNFRLIMQAQATSLTEESGHISGLITHTPDGPLKINADLVVAADGRHSTLRTLSGLPVKSSGAPIDVLWMKISRKSDDPALPLGRFDRGRVFVMLYREDFWQCAFVIRKDGYDDIKSRGLENFRAAIAEAAPFVTDRLHELASWDDIKLLTIAIDHLKKWHKPGLLCIGDAAHAMSPIGGVGINLAIQDAVAAANLLSRPLKGKNMTENDLHRVQKRRLWPARMTQSLQIMMQNQIFSPIISGKANSAPPLLLRLMIGIPFIRRIPARLIGMGFRPEHIQT